MLTHRPAIMLGLMVGLMVQPVAVLSDIHGVLPALDAVLAEPDVLNADRIVLTGDIASGPMPVETIDRLVGLGDQVVWVSGNADRELVEIARGSSTGELPDEISGWAAAQLRPDQIDLLAGLPDSLTLTLAGFGEVLFCHATPRDDSEMVVVDSRLDRWSDVLDGVSDDVGTVVLGHTHMPFARLAHGRLVINPGSIGMPYGRSGAHWALLHDGAVTLRRTAYDVAAAAQQIAAWSSYPDVRTWIADYVIATASDVEALSAFGPLDGR